MADAFSLSRQLVAPGVWEYSVSMGDKNLPKFQAKDLSIQEVLNRVDPPSRPNNSVIPTDAAVDEFNRREDPDLEYDDDYQYMSAIERRRMAEKKGAFDAYINRPRY